MCTYIERGVEVDAFGANGLDFGFDLQHQFAENVVERLELVALVRGVEERALGADGNGAGGTVDIEVLRWVRRAHVLRGGRLASCGRGHGATGGSIATRS